MKLVLDTTVVAKWYLHDPDVAKALKLRFDFHAHLHELLAPDRLPADSANMLVAAERKGSILPGEADLYLNDLLLAGVTLHPSIPYFLKQSQLPYRPDSPLPPASMLLSRNGSNASLLALIKS